MKFGLPKYVVQIRVSRDTFFDEDELIRRKRKKEIVILSNSDNEEDPQKIDQLLSPPLSSTQRNEDTVEDHHKETEVNEHPRRSSRKRELPGRHGVSITGNWWQNNVACVNGEYSFEEPTTMDDTLNGSDKEQWKQALDSEYSAHIKNNTWTLVDLPESRKAIDSRWVFKVKYNAGGSVERHKARLVAKGFSEEAGLDYEETFSPVAKYKPIRSLLAIANQ